MIVSEEENGGARQRYQVRLPARRPSPPLHYHVTFTETFSVLEGALDLYLGRDRKHILLHPYQSMTVHVGQLHTFANERDEYAVITIETIPAAGVVRAFQLAFRVANEGGAAQDGLPKSLLLRLAFIRISGGYLPSVPLILQKSVLALASFVARFTGVSKVIP